MVLIKSALAKNFKIFCAVGKKINHEDLTIGQKQCHIVNVSIS